MTDAELRQSIIDLAHMEVELSKKSGPAKPAKRFDKILMKSDEILKRFGLPFTPYYQALLEFDAVPWDKELDSLIALLKRDAQNQKSKNAQTELEILINAQKTNRDPMFILPQLGIATHVYTLFVYNKILMHIQDDFQNILEELKTANNPDLLNAVGLMNFSTDWLQNDEETIAAFEAQRLKYIRRYALEIMNYLKACGFKINGF
jgi:hypothetical protein